VQSDGGGSEQIGLNGQNIAVAAGVMKDGFDGGVLLDLDAEALRAHTGRGARRIGDIDGIDAEAGEEARAVDFPGTVNALGARFDEGDEFAVFDARSDEGTAAERCRRRFGIQNGRCTGAFDAALRIDGAHGRAHGANVIRRGSAAAAHDLGTGGDGLASEAGHVFGEQR